MRRPTELLEIYRRGDALPDDELEVLATRMEAVAEACSGLGDLFTLQYAYARQVADACRGFQKARAERKQRESTPTPPEGYKELPKGVRCRCMRLWLTNDGKYWCCNQSLSHP